MCVFITRVGIRRSSMISAQVWEYEADVCFQREGEHTAQVCVFSAGVAIRHGCVCFTTRVGIRRNFMISAQMWENGAGACFQRGCEHTMQVGVFSSGVAMRHACVFSSQVWEFDAIV